MKALLISSVVISGLLLFVLPPSVVGILFLAWIGIDILVFKDYI